MNNRLKSTTMQDKKNLALAGGVALLILLGVSIFALGNKEDRQPGKYDSFAKCLKEKGAVFYGAFWCPHCENQKKMFGTSARFLPYVECSTPDGKGQTATCKEKQIKGYPTWEFADGSRESGELSLKHLSEKTGCSLP